MNIVQVEFFHTRNRSAASLEQVLGECVDRVRTDSPIKTCVRFFDTQGIFTRIVLTLEYLQKRMLLERSAAARSFKLKQYAKLFATRELGKIGKREDLLAIEQHDHSYRLVRKDEMHELVESVQKTEEAWFFVFPPNDLCADSHKSVLYSL